MTRSLSLTATLTTFVAVSAVLIVPLLFVAYPPIHDYPFHLARVHILANLEQIPEFQTWYSAGSLLLPNVGMDAIAVALAQFMPIDIVGRAFLGMTMLLTLSGAVALHRVLFGRFSLWPFVSAFFIYNWILLFGFLGYLLGMALLLWAAAAWIWLGSANVWLRAAAGVVIATVMYFCHMVTFGLYALFVCGYEIQRNFVSQPRQWTQAIANLVAAGVPFVIPTTLYFMWRHNRDSGGLIYVDDWLFRKAANFRTIAFGDWVLDISLAVAMLAVAAVIWRYGRLRIDRRVVLPMILIFVAYMAMPTGLATAWYVDTRLPIAIVFILIAATQADIDRPAVRKVMVAGLALFLALRAAWLTLQWHDYDKVIRELVTAFGVMQSNSILFVVSAAPVPQVSDVDLYLWQPPLKFLASYAALERPVFVPTTFADRRSQPLEVKEQFDSLYDLQRRKPLFVSNQSDLEGVSADLRDEVRHSGAPDAPVYVLLLYPERMSEHATDGHDRVAQGTNFELLLISPGG